jgi:hypothetical protein
MIKTNALATITILAILCACNHSPKSETSKKHKNDRNQSDSVDFYDQTKQTSTFEEEQRELDTTTTFGFADFSLTINRFIIQNVEIALNTLENDTVQVSAQLGENIENQLISITKNKLTNILVEQRYCTSVTLSNEGPHCDLTEWKHYYSDWKPLKNNGSDQFLCEKYSEKEREQFLEISVDDLKKEVETQCGEDWFQLVKNIKSITEYPSSVGISHYYIRITGEQQNKGIRVTKLIIIDNPMGC